ncbi:uncharacterized protein HKW66_Vig0146080 [Vigna angularis]|uniref:Uncharacterized protein n=1 Tax=Phaseolus angularis TaxID=3914 RepID=A0A8T0KC15_PHAAN|nr:uncharacterized protein HKW66_Vig0146080 [Vigna angularis]
MFEATIVVHGMELSYNGVKVTVDEIGIPDAIVFVPTDEIFTMDNHFNLFSFGLDNELMMVPWDSTIFLRDSEIPLNLHKKHVFELASGK